MGRRFTQDQTMMDGLTRQATRRSLKTRASLKPRGFSTMTRLEGFQIAPQQQREQS